MRESEMDGVVSLLLHPLQQQRYLYFRYTLFFCFISSLLHVSVDDEYCERLGCKEDDVDESDSDGVLIEIVDEILDEDVEVDDNDGGDGIVDDGDDGD